MTPLLFYRILSGGGLLLGAAALWGAPHCPARAARWLLRLLGGLLLGVGLLASFILLGGYVPMPLDV